MIRRFSGSAVPRPDSPRLARGCRPDVQYMQWRGHCYSSIKSVKNKRRQKAELRGVSAALHVDYLILRSSQVATDHSHLSVVNSWLVPQAAKASLRGGPLRRKTPKTMAWYYGRAENGTKSKARLYPSQGYTRRVFAGQEARGVAEGATPPARTMPMARGVKCSV